MPSAPRSACRIVRNLTTRKGRPPKPMRSWMKNTGPRDSSLIPSAMRAISGAMATRAMLAMTTDIPRLSASCARETRKPSPKISPLGVSDSTASRRVKRSYASVPSSTRTPRNRHDNSAETGRLPRRSGMATMMRSGRARSMTSGTSP